MEADCWPSPSISIIPSIHLTTLPALLTMLIPNVKQYLRMT